VLNFNFKKKSLHHPGQKPEVDSHKSKFSLV
jgi:hypothetical protein